MTFSKEESDQNRRISIVIGFVFTVLSTPFVVKKLIGRADLNLKASFHFTVIEAGTLGGIETFISLIKTDMSNTPQKTIVFTAT